MGKLLSLTSCLNPGLNYFQWMPFFWCHAVTVNSFSSSNIKHCHGNMGDFREIHWFVVGEPTLNLNEFAFHQQTCSYTRRAERRVYVMYNLNVVCKNLISTAPLKRSTWSHALINIPRPKTVMANIMMGLAGFSQCWNCLAMQGNIAH